MDPEFEGLGIGRTPMRSEEFRKKTGEAIAELNDTRDFGESGWTEFQTRLRYLVGHINDPMFYLRLRVRPEEMELEEMEKNGSSPNHLFCISTPSASKSMIRPSSGIRVLLDLRPASFLPRPSTFE
jgi:glucose-6-phosphate 1-dehydrogenase